MKWILPICAALSLPALNAAAATAQPAPAPSPAPSPSPSPSPKPSSGPTLGDVVVVRELDKSEQDGSLAVAPPPPQGMMTGYLKIPDIKGESQRQSSGEAHLDYLTITLTNTLVSQSQVGITGAEWTTAGALQARTRRLAVRQARAGARPHAPLKILKQVDTSTPLLIVEGQFDQCIAGQKAPRMTVQYGETDWDLMDVEVVGCGIAAPTSGDADDRPTEEVSFYYNKVAFSYSRKDMVVKGKKILEN